MEDGIAAEAREIEDTRGTIRPVTINRRQYCGCPRHCHA
jgi:hypothetical protein